METLNGHLRTSSEDERRKHLWMTYITHVSRKPNFHEHSASFFVSGTIYCHLRWPFAIWVCFWYCNVDTFWIYSAGLVPAPHINENFILDGLDSDPFIVPMKSHHWYEHLAWTCPRVSFTKDAFCSFSSWLTDNETNKTINRKHFLMLCKAFKRWFLKGVCCDRQICYLQ